MIEFKSNKPKISINYKNPEQVELTLTASRSVAGEIEGLSEDKEIIVSIKVYDKKRSLSQNSYLWVLLDKLGSKLARSKIDIYRDYIRDYGVFEILPIRNDAVNSFITKWQKNGLGWICDDIGESKLDGYTKIITYFGSSSYTSKEMSRLVDAVIRDCEEFGIATLTYDEFMKLKNEND